MHKSWRSKISIAIIILLVLAVGLFLNKPTKSLPKTGATETLPDLTAITGDPVIVAAGDIACGDSLIKLASECKHVETAKLIEEIDPNLVLTLGDIQYPTATKSLLENYYHPTWGRFKNITRPTIGNHELADSKATDYFNYFGELAGEFGLGYYSFDMGKWHLISLNSNTLTQAQLKWLQEDLQSHQSRCTLAYYHHPRFSSGMHGSDIRIDPLWQILQKNSVDLVLNGHDHTYERFAKIDGMRQFIVGTGGRNLYGYKTIHPSSEIRQNESFGVLKLTLKAESFDWEFVPIKGSSFTDSGSESCH